jgi:hypothetical protein
MSGGGIALFAVFGAACIALVLWSAAKERKRQARLREFCLSQGWSYTESDQSLVGRWRGTPFETGDNRKARNAIGGSHGPYAMTAFDYSYETHSTDSKGNRTTTTHHFGIVSLELPAYLPTLSVTPENVLTRLGGAVGLGDIQLESEDFNRKFRVKCKDPKFASDVLHPRTMERLLAQQASNWRICGTDIICWETGRLSPEVILARASLLALVVDGVPSFVWRDHGFDQGHAPDQDLLGGTSL